MIPQKAVAGYTIKSQKRGVEITRSYAGVSDTRIINSFEEAVDFLTVDYPNTLHVVWSLRDFTEILFKLLPLYVQTELAEKPKITYGTSKIFYTGKVLGLTATRYINKSNFVQKQEVNIYQLQHWLQVGEEPQDAKGVAVVGERILKGLSKIGIYPETLPSPVGVFVKQLNPKAFPTIYNFKEEWIEAMDYASEVAPLEWRSAYKVGYWEKTFAIDKVMAYLSLLATLPDTRQCTATKSDKTDSLSSWGIVYGEVEVTAPISLLVYKSNDGFVNPVGKWTGYFTTEEIDWLYRWKAGNFVLKDGWFISWKGHRKPYFWVARQLLNARKSVDEDVSATARRIGQGLSGKLDQRNMDGSVGELCNYILAAMIRSRCRIEVADYIYNNRLLESLIAVQVDGAIFEHPVVAPEGWRAEEVSPALVLGKGEIWRADKKPLGLSREQVVEAFKTRPSQRYYQFGNKYIDLEVIRLDKDREYNHFPETGGEALSSVSSSEPIKVGGAVERKGKP